MQAAGTGCMRSVRRTLAAAVARGWHDRGT